MSQSDSTDSALREIRASALILLHELEDELRDRWPDAYARLRPAAGRSPDLFEGGGYGRVTQELIDLLAELARDDESLRSVVLRFMFLSRLQQTGSGQGGMVLPRSVLELYPRELRRILGSLRDGAGTVDLVADRWKKNYAILTGRLLPVGAEFADIGSGIPRSALLKGGFSDRLRMFRTIALETRGLKPLLELHAHTDSLEDFHPEGWYATYHRLAELLELNPRYKGVMAASWFRDPALATISPRLRYLRAYPEQHGARLFRIAVDTRGTSGALARSPTRQRLFREGKYVPAIHLMVWPRAALLDWYRREEARRDG